MIKKIVIPVFFLLSSGFYPLTAQLIFYSNPVLEQEQLENGYPHYLIGQMKENILIGRMNEKGFYMSVYNDKMSLKNNVIYKELNPNYFQILDVVNLTDIGILLVSKKTMDERDNTLLYTVAFSENGIPIGEAYVVDTIQASRYTASRVYKVVVSENRKFVLVTIVEERPKGYFIKAVLLNSDNTVVAKYALPLAFDTHSERLQNFQLDNDGNVYVFKEVYKERLLTQMWVYFLQSDAAVLYQKMEFTKMKIKEMRVQLNNFVKRIFFYGIYEGFSHTDIGVYSIFYDINRKNFQGENKLSLHTVIPDMKVGQMKNLHLNELVFLKDSGMIINAQVRYAMQKGGNLNNSYYMSQRGYFSPFSPFVPFGYSSGLGLGGGIGLGGGRFIFREQ